MRWFRRAQVWIPTWPTWAAGLLILIAGARVLAPCLYDVLAAGRNQPAEYIVVEGWLPDYAVPATVRLIRDGAPGAVFTTGGPIERGEYLEGYKTFAEAACATLVAAGIETARVIAVPAPAARRDRTFASAIALRRYFDAVGIATGSVALVTIDTHARRSRALFRRALGPGFRVESIPYPCPRYGRSDWWRSSEGARAVIGEALAWLHVALFPPDPAGETEPAPQTAPQVTE